MRKTSPLDALFPKTRTAVLATMYLNPARAWYLSELARHLKVQPSSLQRELPKLTAAGILRKRDEGNRAYYSADVENPIFADLRGLLLRTAGLVEVLAASLKSARQRIVVAFVYGSIARREERSASDIDLMVIGQVGLAELAPVLRKAERTLSRPINPSTFSPETVAARLASRDHFLGTVMNEPKLFVLGGKDELEAITRLKPTPEA
jgi:DNA-binding transcriptional ArsR family regulator